MPDDASSEKSLEESIHRLSDLVIPYGLTPEYTAEGVLGFIANNEGRRIRVSIPIEDTQEVADILDDDFVIHEDWFAIFRPKIGYAEFIVRPERVTPLSSVKLDVPPHGCRHAPEEGRLSSIPYSRRSTPIFAHAANPATRACIELSGASPSAFLFGPGILSSIKARVRPWEQEILSVKVDLGQAHTAADLKQISNSLVDSFLYELDIRHALRFIKARKWSSSRLRGTPGAEEEIGIRFPQIKIGVEAANLFSFGSGARDSPTLSFLSYYQILEHFFPKAARLEAIRRIRKEVTDPRFTANFDEAITRILDSAEKFSFGNELSHLKSLLERVRSDCLEDFFSKNDWGNHFSKNGPIVGVEHINRNNVNTPLSSQVAQRVYAIRNRIVHAKDERQYEEVKILLPESREAHRLGPDLVLIRLLASEVILDFQQ